ncbi:MAG: hypothetical protein Alpg2KO_18400 [Alphaproteobacteria bacterium]
MTDIPPKSDLTGGDVDEGTVKAALDQLVDALTERLVDGTSLIINFRSTGIRDEAAAETLVLASSGLMNYKQASPTLRIEDTNTTPSAGDLLGVVNFYSNNTAGAGVGGKVRLKAKASGSNASGAGLEFEVTPEDGSLTSAMEILEDGKVLIGASSASGWVTISHANANGDVLDLNASDASYTGSVARITADRTASTAFNFIRAVADINGTQNPVFNVRGDGEVTADGSFTGGGADFAEYFEWQDGNPAAEDRVGLSVVLDGDKIRPAQDGEQPIGVVSANPTVTGDAAPHGWQGRWQRDRYGRILKDRKGNLIESEAYDPAKSYTPRAKRDSWAAIGLIGKLPLRTGQPVGDNWLRLSQSVEGVETWLIR